MDLNVFFVFQPIAAIILICVQTDQLMAMGAFSRFALESFWIILEVFDMPLLYGKTNQSRLILYTSYPSPGINHLSNKSCFPLGEIGI